MTCEQCGAPLGELVCEHCGTLTSKERTPAHERLALEQLHKTLSERTAEDALKLLASAFIPDDGAVLIEAGTRCAVLVDEDGDPYLAEGAAQRLDGIVRKLRIAFDEPKYARAADEFAKDLDAFRADHRRWNRIGCALLALLGVSAVAAGVYLVTRL